MQHELPRNDDNSSTRVDLPFPLNFYGNLYERVWINNNGNVTFDSALSEYTPFGLAGTRSVIIAPFFADVDTRGANSEVVRYGYGETLYQGRRALCVNWIDVGYFNRHDDKLNSFQLLLVQREDGAFADFDIVFNYGSLQWEAGDESGGSGGLGGSVARVGYSNGGEQAGTSFELVGSGRPGFFLDSSPTGLIHHSLNSGQDGRYVFHVRNGSPLPSKYVALGDSFQAGVGTRDYYPETDVTGINECHRSPLAYAPLLTDSGRVPYSLDFVACQGATTREIPQTEWSTSGPPWNEGAQLEHLDENTALFTIGVGGNDIGFAPVLQDCILRSFGDRFVLPLQSCKGSYEGRISDALDALLARSQGTGLNPLQELYRRLRFRAYRGRGLVLGYPRFFPADGGAGTTTEYVPGFPFRIPRCNFIRVSDQIWINDGIRQLNTIIRASARSMGLEFVDIYDAPAGHELCNSADETTFLNGITPSDGLDRSFNWFHPARYGHEVIASRLMDILQSAPAGTPRLVLPGKTVSVSQTVEGGPGVSFSTRWPGSDVVTTLRTPSGRVIGRNTVAGDVLHQQGAQQELYFITQPEPGSWTIELYGADVRPEGEPAMLDVFELPVPEPNQKPVASISMSVSGRTVTLDASGSTDPDGQVTRYLWEFDDGELIEGVRVTHLYPGPGTYRVTLVVEDDQGAHGFSMAAQDVIVPQFDFKGFEAPIENPPARNTVAAGQVIPVTFSLGGERGRDIFDPGSPAAQLIDCASGEPLEAPAPAHPAANGLTYDAATDRYTYEWQTDQLWAGSCRRLIVLLIDAGQHTADFHFPPLEDGDGESSKGCGCGQTGPGSLAVVVLLVSSALVARRRGPVRT